MKIAICYTNFENDNGKPLLSQNRQFQWYTGAFSYAVYPVVMASAATILKNMGHEVIWMDYIARSTRIARSGQATFEEFVSDFSRIKPDLAVFESKTPVIKKHWRLINFLKKKCPKTRFVLCGDHVSALPSETLKNSKVDYVLVGGDFDFLLAELVKKLPISSLREIPSGNNYQLPNNIQILSLKDQIDLDKLPMIDRGLTMWELYSENNGNYKYTPGAYTMAGRDCWWRRKQLPMKHQFPSSKIQMSGCTFCAWAGLYPKWRVVKPEKLLEEIEYLISLGVKEVFDDTGTFPVGSWLTKFCFGMIERGLSKKIVLGCNMRAGVLKQEDYNLMKKAGFRFILFGAESANNETLEKINKGVTAEQIESALKMAKKAGLSPHATIMFGYPWESLEDARRTVSFAKKLFNEGAIDSLQATIVIPYPGTKLFEECKKNKLLKTLDWEQYDMRMPIMKCPIPDEKLKELVRECYSSFFWPRFILRKIGEIRSLGDIKYLGFMGMKYLSKRGDFR